MKNLMKSQQYYELCRRYEREAKDNPERFHRRLRRHLWIGYGYVGFILVLLCGLTITLLTAFCIRPNFVLFMFFVFSGAFVWDLLTNLLEKIPPMDGIKLHRDQTPLFFAEMDELREQMDIHEIDEVILTTELNAQAGEYRSRFFVGKKRRYVGVGLPLLEALNIDEFRSVLAHEIAHLARGHSKLHATVWHLRNVWGKILHSEGVSFYWRWFAMYYGERFEAMAAVISREYELEADRIASEVIDNQNMISAQLKLDLLSHATQNEQIEWINAQVLESPIVPKNAISTFCQRLKRPLDDNQAKKFLRRILAEETSIYLTHPSCRDRIGQAGFPVDQPLTEMIQTALTYIQPTEDERVKNASFHFLGSRRDSFMQEFDDDFVIENEMQWEYRTEYIASAKKQIEEIDQRIATAEGSQKNPEEVDLEHRASIMTEIFDSKTANQAFEKVLEHYPENASALYWTGFHAYQNEYDLAKADERLSRSIESEPRLEYDVSNYMVAVCREMEKPDEAKQWEEHSLGAYDALMDSSNERATVTKKDKFIPATLTDEQIDKIVQQIESLENLKNIKRVWVGCKKVKFYPEKPLYVLGVEPNVSSFSYQAVDFFNLIGEEFGNTINFGEQYFVVVLQGENRTFKKKLKRLKPPLCIDIAGRARTK